MKRIIPIVLALGLALSVAGCANGQLPNIFASISNPVKPAALDAAEEAYDASLKVFIKFRDYCNRRLIPSACRTYVIQGQRIIPQAEGARAAAESFVANNPTLDATKVISVYSDLVTKFTTTSTRLSTIN